ncbi:uncharacterized protein OCT59_012367 [Rhizophagus irregularis]|uniref:Ion transport domain-containing protein n=1 Tax=Rhizophagus irregularis (strain DAOM 197198w) TaxID=1432141 RepID=A0A015KHW3_RHIIW|nr:hypothetical protein RirG_191100 [Rhizophagus irregularis DAOM 197198w]UZO01265.1 hypothetical protein OCT59_012367 [Rhizophagus irregularis]GET64737.1 hypothetical protein GLOIN_2v1874143 [Rhizophagus irregularis DAOM 181602=DAOM 197198]
MSDLSIEIKEIDDNITDETKVNIDNGKPITKIEVSPNEEYLVIYNQEDKSIIGWNIYETNKTNREKRYTVDEVNNLDKICVSDDKNLVYICNNKPRIIDMNNNTKEIKLYDDESIYENHCTFNVKGEFIMCNKVSNQKILRIYSTKTKNNKWMCKQIYEIPQDYEIINISKYNKLYLLLRNCIYEWDIVTKKNIRIFADEDDEEIEKRDIRISSNERFICLSIKYEKMDDENFEDEKFNDKKDLKDKIIIYSIELEIPIATLDINDDISLYDIMKDIDLTLYPLLLTLFDRSSEIWNSIMKYYWKVCLDGSNVNHHLSKEYRPAILSNNIQITTKYAFGILDDDFLKIKFEEKLLLENWDKLCHENDETIIECWNMYLNSDERDVVVEIKDMLKYLKILLFNPYKNILCALFREVKKVMDDVSPSEYPKKYEDELIYNTIKWKIKINDVKIVLQVFKRNDDISKWSSICKRIEKHNFGKGCLLGIRLIDNNVIVILTNIGLFIYYFNECNISLNYFYHMDLLSQDYENIFSKITLPLPSVNSFKLNGWALNLANNKLSLLKYGVELLKFAIEVNNLELIEHIYKNCMNYFKQDLRNNRIFLSIITSNMPLLKRHFPRYIERYSLETDLIIDDTSYSISSISLNNANPPHIFNLTGSILWTNYGYLLRKLYKKLHKYCRNSSEDISDIQKITFMVPFIKFFNYPQDYKWWSDFLLPQPSPFVETLSKDIYKTRSGRAIFRFKWRSCRLLYFHIMLIHAILAVYFAFAFIYGDEDDRKTFLLGSIIFGSFYLTLKLRQLIYSFNNFKLQNYKLNEIWLISGLLFGIKI